MPVDQKAMPQMIQVKKLAMPKNIAKRHRILVPDPISTEGRRSPGWDSVVIFVDGKGWPSSFMIWNSSKASAGGKAYVVVFLAFRLEDGD